MNDPILEEIYQIRAQIWKECGETIDGYFAYMSRPISGVRYADLPTAKPRRPAAPATKLPRAATRVRPPRAAMRKKAARP